MHLIQIENVLEEKAKQMGKVHSHEKVDILNIQMRQGEFIPEHNVNNVAVVTVRKGKVRFNVEGVDHLLTAQDVLILDPLEMHSLEALEETEIVVVKVN
jgi:quercetin dioxygenase-like cupin family protein